MRNENQRFLQLPVFLILNGTENAHSRYGYRYGYQYGYGYGYGYGTE